LNLQDIGSLGEFLAAIATIATLFYLALQIRQSTRTTQASAHDAILAQWREHLRETFTTNSTNLDVWRKGLSDLESLDASDKARFTFIISQEQLFIENMIHQHERGNIDSDLLQPWLDYFSREVRTPGGTAWWKMASPVLNPAFVKTMQAHLDATVGTPDLLEAMPVFK